MTTLVALVLALLSTGLKGIHDKNEAIYNKKAILGAIADNVGLVMTSTDDNQLLEIFNSNIAQKVVNYIGQEVSKEEVEARGYIGGMAENVDMAIEI